MTGVIFTGTMRGNSECQSDCGKGGVWILARSAFFIAAVMAMVHVNGARLKGLAGMG
eukprot:COSAG05_NODE_32_length_28165_cov_450.666714_19_plen_57_part_00